MFETLKNVDFSSARVPGLPTMDVHTGYIISTFISSEHLLYNDYGAVGVHLHRSKGSPTIFNLLIPLVIFDPTMTALHTTYE